MLKKIVIALVILVVGGTAAAYSAKSWIKGIVPDKQYFTAIKQSKVHSLSYVTDNVPEYRGRILAVVTSTARMGESGKKTGYELTELARAYWVFKANGFEVDIASPKGGKAPVVIDGDDMGEFDYAFLNDAEAQAKAADTIKIQDVVPLDYEAVYFVGGKGTMFDFPDNRAIQNIVKTLYQNGRVVSAVCHGPAALVNVKLDNGEWLVANKNVSAFTNEEELFLIPDAAEIFPFMLQDQLSLQGAKFNSGQRYLRQTAVDGKLITGQNPWSVWALAEQVIETLGYLPKPREITSEEHAVELLMVYENDGEDAALQFIQQSPEQFQRLLLLMHGVVAFMDFELGKGWDLFMLAQALKSLEEANL